jgi:hypothetical protein
LRVEASAVAKKANTEYANKTVESIELFIIIILSHICIHLS